jgi:hypothetical protein
MGKYLRISSYIRKPFLIYDFASAPLCNFHIYEEIFFFFYFISVNVDWLAAGGLTEREVGAVFEIFFLT